MIAPTADTVPGWLATRYGAIDLDGGPEQIDPDDIAHHLAHTCRWAGATTRFYSVAEHSARLSWYAEKHRGPHEALVALLHDATEAYLPDLPTPWKVRIPGFSEAEARLEKRIAARFGLPSLHTPYVREIDARILLDERAHLIRPLDADGGRPWGALGDLAPLGVRMPEPLPNTDPVEAWRTLWLAQLRRLRAVLGGTW